MEKAVTSGLNTASGKPTSATSTPTGATVGRGRIHGREPGALHQEEMRKTRVTWLTVVRAHINSHLFQFK